MSISDLDSERLAKVLALIDSDRDGEALSALHKARAILARSGLKMKDILRPSAGADAFAAASQAAYAPTPGGLGMDARREIESLRMEADGLRVALQSKDAETASLHKFRDEAFQILAAKNDEIMRLKRDLLEARTDQAAADPALPQEVGDLRRALAETDAHLEEERTRRAADIDSLSRKDTEIASLKVKLEDQQRAFAEVRARDQQDDQEVRAALAKLDAEAASLRRFRDEALLALTHKSDRIGDLQRRLDHFTQALAALRSGRKDETAAVEAALEETETALEAARTEARHAEESSLRHARDANALRRQLDTLRITVSDEGGDTGGSEWRLREAVLRLDAEVTALRQLRDETNEILARQGEEIAQLKSRRPEAGPDTGSEATAAGLSPAPTPEVAVLQTEIAERDNRISDLDQVVVSLKADLETAERDRQTAAGAAGKQAEKLMKALAEAGHLKALVAARDKDLAAARRDAAGLKARITALESEVAAKSQETAQRTVRVTELRSRLQTEREKRQGERSIHAETVKQLEAKLADLQQQGTELRTAIEDSAEAHRTLERDLAKARRPAAAAPPGRVQELEAQVADLQAQLTDRSREAAEVHNLRALLAGRKAAANEAKELKAQVEAQSRRLAELEPLRGRLAEMEALRKRVAETDALRKRLSETEALRKRATETEALRERLKTLEGMAAMVPELRGRLDAKEKEAAALQIELENVRPDVDAAAAAALGSAEAETLKHRLREEIEREVLTKLGQDSGMGGFQDKALQVLSEKNEEIAQLRERLNGMESQLEGAKEAAAPRSNAEKRQAVLDYLRDPERSKLPDREIARQVGVSPQTVSNWRKRLSEEG